MAFILGDEEQRKTFLPTLDKIRFNVSLVYIYSGAALLLIKVMKDKKRVESSHAAFSQNMN